MFLKANFQSVHFIIFNAHIFDTSVEYFVEHARNLVLDDELQIGNIIVAECALEKFTESRGSKLKKVGFKMLGIGFIDKGFPPVSKICTIMPSPLISSFCQFSRSFIFLTFPNHDFLPN